MHQPYGIKSTSELRFVRAEEARRLANDERRRRNTAAMAQVAAASKGRKS